MQTRSTRQRGNEQKVLVKRSSTRTAGAEHVYVVVDSETLKRNPLKVTSTNIGQTSQRPVKRRRTQSRTTTRTRTRSKPLPVSSDDDNSVKEEEEEIKEIVKSDSEEEEDNEEEEEDDDDDDDDDDFKPENEAKITQLETSSEEEAEEEAEEEVTSNSSNNRKRSNNSRNRRRYGDETPASPVNEETYRLRLKRQHERLVKVHPTLDTVWEDMDKLPLIEAVCETQPAELKLKLLPFQKEGLGWMLRQEISKFHGGILADEMGMGKTIQMISLMVSRPRGKPNLIIAPTVALMQWNNEINAHTSGLSVLLFHGINRLKDPKAISDYDIVLTTYSTVESTFRKHHYGFRRKGALVKEESPLHKIEWFRIILDEAHYIKDRSCNTARAVFALNSTRKWALSGTPMQNRVGELYSLIRYMRIEPYSYYFCRKCSCKSLQWKFSDRKNCDDCGHHGMSHFCWWNNEILKPIQKFGAEGPGLEGYKKLGKLLDRIMLRRTKNERADDLGLPPKTVTIRRDYFSEEEDDFYQSLYMDIARKFNTYVEAGTVLHNYAHIFELLSRMRLAANHPELIRVNKRKDTLVCGICNDEPEDPIISKCKHVFCREDAHQYISSCIDELPLCPVCYARLTLDLSQPTYEMPVQSANTVRKSIVNEIDMNNWRSSTKIEALVEELDSLRRRDTSLKSLIFSQFTGFLDLVQWRLNRAGYRCCRLDGRMGPMQRDAVIQAFMSKPELTVFLVSLKAGGIALNLTEASQVFIMDPWWNPAVEEQAMDRIHRLGQYRPIRVTRLIVENSIESRIVQLQEKKQALFQSTIGKDEKALARLTEEDLRFLFVL